MAAIMLVGCVACGPDEPAGPTATPERSNTGDPLVDNLLFHVDFSKESHEDVVRNAKATVAEGEGVGTITYVEDEEEGKVANFQNTCVAYDIDLNSIGKNYTMEAYVKCKKQGGLGVICGTYFHNDKAGVSFTAGMFDTGNGKFFGSAKAVAIVSGTLTSTRTIETGYYRQWNHLVFVHDGETGKETYYLNGVAVPGYEDGVHVMKGPMKHSRTDSTFKIGAYNGGAQFAVEDMNLAYVKLYDFAATADNVKTMFDNK